MAKGLGIMIGIPSKKSMYEDKGADDESSPESSRGEEKSEALTNMRLLFPDADKADLPDMLEALKAIVGECMAEGGEAEADETEE